MPTYLSRLHLTRHMPPPVAGGGMSHLPPAHPSPPRPTQLPVISPCHMPHTSAHAVSPLASTARTHPHRAHRPHSLQGKRLQLRAMGEAICHMPSPLWAKLSGPPVRRGRDGRMHLTPRTATRDTTVPHAIRIGARRIATRRDRTPPPPPRPTQLPAIRRCHMPHASTHAASPLASTARSRHHHASHSYP